MSVGTRVKTIRLARGWSLRDLAQKSGLSAGYLSQLENERRKSPSATSIAALSGAFNIGAEVLLSDSSPFIQESVAAFAAEEGLALEDVIWLSQVQVRGRRLADGGELRRVYHAVMDEIGGE